MNLPSHEATGTGQRETARKRIFRTAAQLFAERGFHGTSIRDIAAASEVSVSTVLYHAGSKQQLLERILADSFSGQTPLLQAALQLDPAAMPDFEAFLSAHDAFIDVLIEHSVEFPQTRRLWLRLLLDEPELFAKLDAEYSRPLVERVMTLLQTLRDRRILATSDEQLRLFVASIDWILDGFFSGGNPTGDALGQPLPHAADVQHLAAFLKAHGRSFFTPRS
ncbi:MAG: TetR/AcrR family transcriptional regulator [Planctomycetaceae bacterium]|nr:TetR/AcrR family transcriptional regulator [Planctomycetaceae bacterium]